VTDDKTYGCRLSDEEQDYIKNYWNGRFSDFVHASIKEQNDKILGNQKKNLLFETVIGLFGVFFIIQGFETVQLLNIIVYNAIGLFCLVYLIWSVAPYIRLKIGNGGKQCDSTDAE